MQLQKEIRYRHEVTPSRAEWSGSPETGLRSFVQQHAFVVGLGFCFWPVVSLTKKQEIWNSSIDEVRKKVPFLTTQFQWTFPTNDQRECSVVFLSGVRKSLLSSIILDIRKLLTVDTISKFLYWGIESTKSGVTISLQKYCLVSSSWTILFSKDVPCFEGSILVALKELAGIIEPEKVFQGVFQMWELPRKSKYSMQEYQQLEPALKVLST